MEDLEIYAKASYEAFSRSCGFEPEWHSVGDSIKRNWIQAARAILHLKGLMDIQKITASGYAGVTSSGGIVDRRIFPEAVVVKANPLLKIPEPKKL